MKHGTFIIKIQPQIKLINQEIKYSSENRLVDIRHTSIKEGEKSRKGSYKIILLFKKK